MFKKMNNKGEFGIGLAMVMILTTLVAVGETGRQAGKMGVDGELAVKECAGTHTNCNCAHLPLTDYEKNNFDWIK